MRYNVGLMKNNVLIWKAVFAASIIIFLLAQLVFSTGKTSAFALEKVAAQSSETDWWPMFRHDLSHNGHSTSEAPNKNETLWVYETRHQIGSSAAVFEGVVFIGSYDHFLYALNATTGLLIWKYETGGEIFSSPSVENDRVFVSASNGELYALNVSTGEHLWSFEAWGLGHSSPAVAEDKVFIGSGFDHKVYALDEVSGVEIWNFTTGGSIISSPAISAGIVYVGSSDDKIYALNASIGAFIWSYTTGDTVNSSPCVVDGKVFIGSSDGNIYALNAGTGVLIWSFHTSPHGVTSPVSSSPAFSDGIVFVGAFGSWGESWPWSFFALNASTGVPIWNYTTGAISYSSPAVADGKVFVMNYGGDVFALNVTNGALVWSYSTGGSASWSSPTVADGRVYVGSGNGKVYCFGSMLYFNITVDPRFYDNRGETLVPPPSSWTILFPNGTEKTVSSTVTYIGPMGVYLIRNMTWKSLHLTALGFPQYPRITLASFFLDSDKTWSPRINCTLPTSLSLSLSSSTSYIGFQIGIEGNLTCNQVGVSNAGILLSYSVTGGESWNDITLINTSSHGSYSAVWMPSATGNYLVRATWTGNSTYPKSTTLVSLAVISSEGKNVFAVESNSTISALAFNSTSLELSFTVTGETGTTGYVKVTIAKNLVSNIADVKVYIDGNQTEYSATSQNDAWILTFTYTHSTHHITVNLKTATTGIPLDPTWIYFTIVAMAIALIGGIVIVTRRKRKLRKSP